MAKTIIVPVDLSHPERMPTMLSEARTLGPDAHILLAYAVEPLPPAFRSEMTEDVLELSLKRAKEKLAELSATAGENIEAVLLQGHAASAILDLAEKRKADIIVIASHKPGWQDFLLGSTAARVVRHAKCSVYVLR